MVLFIASRNTLLHYLCDIFNSSSTFAGICPIPHLQGGISLARLNHVCERGHWKLSRAAGRQVL